MAQLGPRVKILENCMGMAAGAAGIQLWCVLQDISQLRGMFEKTWETFVQNCGILTVFGARDQTTREYVSKLAGTCEVLTHSRSVGKDRMTGEDVITDSASQFGRPLLLPEEVGTNIAPDEMVLFVEGRWIIRAKRKSYLMVGVSRQVPQESLCQEQVIYAGHATASGIHHRGSGTLRGALGWLRYGNPPRLRRWARAASAPYGGRKRSASGGCVRAGGNPAALDAQLQPVRQPVPDVAALQEELTARMADVRKLATDLAGCEELLLRCERECEGLRRRLNSAGAAAPQGG